MKINHIAQVYGVEVQKAAGNRKAVSKPEKLKKDDSVTLSKEGTNLNKTASSVEATSKRIEGLPEIRWDRVNTVKERIKGGYYNSSEFREQLAERLIKDFGLEAP
ncbi:flagellar biosynthesis anti-sigma factor FlgM [Fibrobacterota bacterium]